MRPLPLALRALPCLIAWQAVCSTTARAQGIVAPAPPTGQTLRIAHPPLARLGWQLVAPASVFPPLTCFEMIDRLHAQTVHHLELSPGKPLSLPPQSAGVGPDMAPADREALVAKLHQVHMDVASYGPVAFRADEAAARRVFAFAHALGVKNLFGLIPSADALPLLDRLATEYRVNVALTPFPNQSCDVLLPLLQGRSARIGCCADVAAWKRAGDDPLICLQKLKGRILEVRLGDVTPQGRNVPLGTGVIGAAALLNELKRQNFRGAFIVTYPNDGAADPLTGGWAASANAFSDLAAPLAPAPKAKEIQ